MNSLLSTLKPYVHKWQTWLIIVLIVSTFSRFWQLENIREYVFDEVYHAFTAKMYALNRYEAWVWWESPPEGVAYEWTHPPLAKVIMSWGVQMFGGPGELPTKVVKPGVEQSKEDQEAEKNTNKVLANNPYGWRFFSAFFGVLATFGMFLFISSIFKNKWIGILAAFLFTFDLLPLVQSRVAMNDIFAVCFLLFAFYFFTKRASLLDHRLSLLNWVLFSISLGCAIASKWTSFFAVGILGLYQLATITYYLMQRWYGYKDKHKVKSMFSKQGLFYMTKEKLAVLPGQVVLVGVFMFVVPFAIYLLSYMQLFTMPIYDYKGNSLIDIMQRKQWEEDKKNLETRLEFIEAGSCKGQEEQYAEYCNIEKAKKELMQKNEALGFWGRLYKANPQFADRYYIWWGLQKQMWWYHTNLKASHNYQSQWWTWPLDIRPVWFWVKYCGREDVNKDAMCQRSLEQYPNAERTMADVYTMGNPAIFWFIFPILALVAPVLVGRFKSWFYAIIPACILLLLQWNFTQVRGEEMKSMWERSGIISSAILPQLLLFTLLLYLFLMVLNFIVEAYDKRNAIADNKANNDEHKHVGRELIPLALCLVAFMGFWLPWARSPRIMFFYHFFPPVTFFYPIAAYGLYKLAKTSPMWRMVVFGYIALIVISFVYFYPHVTGMLVPDAQRESYFWLQSWK